jgi:hypothetical protein
MVYYIGCKIIQAYPMTNIDFYRHNRQGQTLPEKEEEGYCVTYPDNYISWSPKQVFETAYRKITKAEMKLLGK